MNPIGSNRSNVPRPKPAASTAAAADKPERPSQPDRFETSPLSPGAARSLVEADLRLSAQGGLDANVEGSVKVQRAFIERLIPYALRDCREIQQSKVSFDPKTHEYTLKAVFVSKGVRIPFTTAVHPTVQKNNFGFQIDQAELKAGPVALDLSYDLTRQPIARTLARVLSRAGFTAVANGAPGFVGLEINAALHQLGAVPYYLRVNTRDTRLSSQVADNGDITLNLHTDRPTLPVKSTPLSDVSLVADEKAIAELLSNLLGDDMEVEGMTFKDNEAVLHGKADAKPVSDALTAFKAIFLLAAVSQGANPSQLNGDPVKVRISVDVAAHMEGHDVVMTTNVDQALPKMMDAFKDLGLNPQLEGKAIRIDTRVLEPMIEGHFDQIAFTPQGLQASAHVNLDRIIGNPALVGQADTAL